MKQIEVVIKAKAKWQILDFTEIWNFRELFYIFLWRDLKIRYKQTLLGITWVIMQPLISMIIFTIFFGNLAKIPSGNLPYSLFVMTGLIFWNFFSGSLARSSNSMLEHENIITKVYFPKIILPFSSIVTFFVDFVINLCMLFIVAAVLGYFPNFWTIIILPIVIILTAITSAGLGLILCSLNVKYRDVRNILPFFIQINLFLTPIIYPLSIVSDRNKIIMAINPMTTVVETARQIFSKNVIIRQDLILISFLSSILILVIGLWYFRKTEKYFADIV